MILAFDVPVVKEAQDLAEELGVKIFCADIIYHLFDKFSKYIEEERLKRKHDAQNKAVFPCVLKIAPNCVFNKQNPIIVGVDVIDGVLKIGTPICVPGKQVLGGRGMRANSGVYRDWARDVD
jgi:translation initiation factor 5B